MLGPRTLPQRRLRRLLRRFRDSFENPYLACLYAIALMTFGMTMAVLAPCLKSIDNLGQNN